MAKVNQPSNLIDRLIRLEREVAELRKRTGLGNAQVSSGRFTVHGGTIEVLDPDGSSIAQIGAHVDGFGNPVTGLMVRRPDGSVSLWAYGDEDGNGFLSVWDENNNVVVSTDGETGQGLATPYIPFMALPNSARFGESTTSPSFVPLWAMEGPKQHPRVKVGLYLAPDTAGASAQAQLRDANTGGIIAPAQTVPFGGANFIELVGPISGAHLEYIKFEVDVRLSAGAGSALCSVAYAVGIQS